MGRLVSSTKQMTWANFSEFTKDHGQ